MQPKLKVYVENNEGEYNRMFEANGWETTTVLEDADLVQLVGGADVSPYMYGEDMHPTTYPDEYADRATQSLYDEAMDMFKPIAGICRGSQFLCVANGGKLFQNVDGHAIGGTHEIKDILHGDIVEVTSTHHQQHRPSDRAIIIAVAYPQLSTFKQHCPIEADGEKGQDTTYLIVEDDPWTDESINDDVEVFYHPDTKNLGVQGHPEYMDKDSGFQKYYFSLIDTLFGLNSEAA